MQRELADATEGIVAIVGFPERGERGLYNSAAVLGNGAVYAIYRKVHLPNYGVFDEQRYFRAGVVRGTVIRACRSAGSESDENRRGTAGRARNWRPTPNGGSA